MPNPKRRHSKSRTAKRRTHDTLVGDAVERLPELPRAETAAPRVPALRVLPRPPGPRRRRSVTPPDHDPHRRRRDGGRPRPPQHHRRRSGCRASSRSRASAGRARPTRFAPSWRDIPTPHQLSIRILDAPDVIGMAEAPAAALAAEAARVDSRRRRGGGERRGVGAGERRAYRRDGAVRRTRAFGMLPGVDRPALAATIPSGDRPRHSARRRRQRRVPRAASAAVRRDGRGVREESRSASIGRASACCRLARKRARAPS